MRSLEEVTKEMVMVLEELGIDYVIVGGLAVAGWGNIRTTRNVDVIFSLKPEDVKGVVRAFQDRGFSLSEDEVLAAMKDKSQFTIFDERSEYHIDAKGAYGENERRTMRTRKKVNISGIDIYIASPEDLIANKLLFGGEQDLKDAEGIYLRQFGKLDLEYLERICEEMNVKNELVNLEERAEDAKPK